MNRLVRAEFYRIGHTGFFLRALLLFFLVLLFFPLVTDFEFFSRTLADDRESIMMGILVCMMFLPAVVSLFVAHGYMKKTAYYEVMAGRKSSHIIGSKLITEGLFLGTVYFIAVIGLGFVVVIKNGVGGVADLGPRFLMLFFVCLHLTVIGTLIGMTIKNYVACLVAYARFAGLDMMISAILLPVLQMKGILGKTACQRFQYCMINTQIETVCRSAEVSAEAVLFCVVSFFVEAIVWYVLVYVTMKKKWYK